MASDVQYVHEESLSQYSGNAGLPEGNVTQ